MKPLILILILFGIINPLQSQNEIASVSLTETMHVKHSKKANNSQYLESISKPNIAVKIKKLQSIAANYNIKTNKIYSKNKSTNYTVVFKEGDNTITTVYNNNGVILNSSEHYKSIRLPYNMSYKLSKSYPGWEFNKVSCNLNYEKNSDSKIVYQVVLKKGNKRKTLHI